MTTKFVDFNNPQNNLEKCEIIMLDTCTMINLASGQKDALEFVKFTLNNEIMLCYSSKSVEELNIMKQSKIFPRDKREANKEMDKFLEQSFLEKDGIINTLNTLGNMYPHPIGSTDGNILNEAELNSTKHKLRWGDAMIYTMAKQNDINCIWTYDQDWKNVNDKDMTVLMEKRFIPRDITINNSLNE